MAPFSGRLLGSREVRRHSDFHAFTLHTTDMGMGRPFPQPGLQGLQGSFVPTGQHLDSSIREIAGITGESQRHGLLTRRGTEEHPLDMTGYKTASTTHGVARKD